MQQILQKSATRSGEVYGEQLTLYVPDSLVKPLVLQEDEEDFRTLEELCFSMLQEPPNKSNHAFYSLFGSRADDTFVIQRSRGYNKGGLHNISPTLTTNSFQDNNFIIQVGNIVENKDTFGGNPQRGRVYSPDGISPCISTIQGGGQEPKIVEDDEIRKLTPRECWRLQGFPDWAFERAKETGMSDTQLYKQAGNSVTVNVIEEIAMKLKEM